MSKNKIIAIIVIVLWLVGFFAFNLILWHCQPRIFNPDYQEEKKTEVIVDY